MLPSNPNLVKKPRDRFINRLRTTKVRIFLLVLTAVLIGAGIVGFFFIQNNNRDVAKAASCTWTGSSSADFSDSGNWSGCGGVPQNGDDVTFPDTATSYSLNNDISGLSLNTITVEALNTSAYTLSGNTLDITYGITTASGAYDIIFDTNVTTCRTEGDGDITINAGVTYTSGCDFIDYSFGGDIHGSGTFVKEGVWNLTLNATQVIDAAFVVNHGGLYSDYTANPTFNNTFTVNNNSLVWALGPLNVLNNPIELNGTSGINQAPGQITAYGINFNGGSSNKYYVWQNSGGQRTTITGSDLNLNGATFDSNYFEILSQQQTIFDTTNGHTISGEFSNLPTGSTAFFTTSGTTAEISATYNSNNVIVEVVSIVASECTWTGNNSGDWSDAGNWSGCSGAAPVNGKKLIFPDVANNYSMNNDISGLTVDTFTIESINSSNYSLTGNGLSVTGNVNTLGGNYQFQFSTNITACGLTGTTYITIDTGNEFTSGGSGCANSSYSGNLSGVGNFNKNDGGVQTFDNATINITVNVNGAFLQLTGYTQLTSNLNDNSGGVLFGQASNIYVYNFSTSGGNANFYPSTASGSAVQVDNSNFSGGNFGFDTNSSVDYGQLNFSNGVDLSNQTMSMRFFNTYNVGDTFSIVTTSGGTVNGQFSNIINGGTLTGEGWGASSIVSNVEYTATYNSNSVVITITDIIPLTCSGNIVYTNTTGTVTSGINNYNANSNCSWVIAPVNADSITFNFTAFDTESGNDEVSVYDGLTTASTLLGTYSGNTIPSSVTANSGAMLITFTSNATTQAAGFTGNWNYVALPGPFISSLATTSGPVAGGTNVTINGSNFVSGQYQDISSIGGSGADGIRGMVVDSSGNQFVTGGFSNSITLGGTTLTSAGSEDIYVAKINPDQTYAWAISAGGSTVDGFTRRQSLKLDTTDNTLIIAGYFTGTATFGGTTLTGSNGANVFIAKLNQSNGSFVWAKQAGGSTNDIYDSSIFPYQYGSSIDVDASGNIYFSGRVHGTVGSNASFGGITKTIANGNDPFVAKLDSSGNFIWVNTYADADSGGYANGLRINSNGDVYALINILNTLVIGGDTLTTYCPSGCQNAVLVKMDNNGDPIWAKVSGSTTAPNANVDLPYDVGLDSNEDVYITGYFGAQTATFGSYTLDGSPTGSTVYTAKLNSSGTFLWARAMPSPGFATSRTMYIDSNDKIWIAGGYDNILTDGAQTITGNSTNAFFAEYDTSGNLQQLKGISGTGGQLAVTGVGGNQVRALAVYNGNLYIAGEYFTTIGIGGQTITSSGNQDGFYTTWVIDKTSVKIDGVEVIADFISATELNFTTPARTKGFKDVVVTNSDGRSYNLTGGFEYIAPEVLNSDITSMTCSPSSTAVNTTVNCTITTATDVSLLSGSVNVRIGSSGTPTNCPVGTSGTTITCNNVAVGSTVGTFASQYNASGSGSTYLNGNDITVTANSNPAILNSDISSMTCSPSSTAVNTTVNCSITTSVDLNTLSGSVNVRIGSSGTPTNCPVTGSGTTLTCNNVAVGGTAGTFASQYNASGSGSTYLNGNDITVTESSNPVIQNSDIVSMTCSPSSTAIATTVNCVITTNVNLNTLSGSVNVRIGTSGNIINCPVTGSGTSLSCNNIPVGVVVGAFYSQFAASGSGSSYINGNQITVTSSGSCTVNISGGGGNTTFAGLCVNTGALTLYPGDSVANNDLCSAGDTGTYQFVSDNGSLADPITCGVNEQTVTYQAINVSATRQSINTTINDILFEDLTGSNLNSYSVSATFGNFINAGTGRNIVLGANPDGSGDETNIDADAPGSANSGKLYCTINPQAVGSKVTGINPGSARQTGNQQKLVKGSKTTIISNSDSVNLFSTGGEQAVPGRYDIDGLTSKCRVPAYSDNGNYSQTIYFTVVAS